MKKFTLIFLILSYSISIIGMSIKSFYCCGKLKSISVSLANNEQKKNSEKSNSLDNDCCKTTYHSFQIKDNHFASDDVNVPAKYFTQIAYDFNEFSSLNFASQEAKYCYQTHAPPLLGKTIPLYISNCVYRI